MFDNLAGQKDFPKKIMVAVLIFNLVASGVITYFYVNSKAQSLSSHSTSGKEGQKGATGLTGQQGIQGNPGVSNNNSSFTDPLTTSGDLLFRDSSNITTRLGVGAEGQVLTATQGLPKWMTVSSGSISSGTQTLIGDKTLNGNTNPSSNLVTTLGGNTTVGGTTTLNGNTAITGQNTLTVGAGTTTLGGTLVSAGLATLNGGTATTTLATSGLASLNSATIATNATVGGTLGVTGNQTNAGTLTVSGVTNLNNSLIQNGIAAPAVSAVGTGQIYFDSTSNTFKVSQNGGAFANLNTGATTNVLSSLGNTLTSVVNGTSATAPIINSNTLSLSGNLLTGVLNGVGATSSVIGTNVVATSNNNLIATINGVLSNTAPIINTNTLTSAANILSGSVNGVNATGVNIINSASLTSAVNSLSGSINGVAISPVNLINSNAVSTTGNNLTSTVNGVASSTAPIINTNTLAQNGTNQLVSTVNGVASTPLSIAGFVDLTTAQTVAGNKSFSGNSIFGGTSTFNGNTAVTGTNTLTVGTGATTLGGNLSVTGNQINTGSLTVGTTLGVTGATTLSNSLTQNGMAVPALSSVGKGRIYFDSTSNTFKASQNGGAYTNLVSGGGGVSLSSLTAATATSTIDNTSFGQTWNWSSLGSGTALSILNTGFFNSTNGIVNIANTSFFTSGTIFKVGANSSSPNTLVVNASGQVGINTNSVPPSYAMKIQGSNNGTGYYGITIASYDNATIFFPLDFTNNSGASLGSVMCFNSTSQCSYLTSSDTRLKSNQKATHFGLDDLMQVQVRDYTIGSEDNQTGFIAQQLYTVYPQAVKVGSDARNENGKLTNPWSVDYGKVTPLLAKSIQDLNTKLVNGLSANTAKLNTLEQKTTTLETKATDLNSRLTALETKSSTTATVPTPAGTSTFDGGIVTKDTEFKGTLTVDQIATFNGMAKFLSSTELQDVVVHGKVVIKGDATIDGQITVGNDTAGSTKILIGNKTIKVKFLKPKSNDKYVVSLTQVDSDATGYKVANKTIEGFEITLPTVATADANFDWIVVGK